MNKNKKQMPNLIKYIHTDFVKVYSSKLSSKAAFYLYFGDPITIEGVAGNWTKLQHLTK